MMILAGIGEENMFRADNTSDVYKNAHNTSEIELGTLLDEMRKNNTLAMIDGVWIEVVIIVDSSYSFYWNH